MAGIDSKEAVRREFPMRGTQIRQVEDLVAAFSMDVVTQVQNLERTHGRSLLAGGFPQGNIKRAADGIAGLLNQGLERWVADPDLEDLDVIAFSMIAAWAYWGWAQKHPDWSKVTDPGRPLGGEET